MKKYKVSELADILGVSYVAVKKKIKPDESNPRILRYKNRYEVVNETVKGRNVTFILLDDEELKTEIEETNVNKTVYSTSNNVDETVEYIDVEHETTNPKQSDILEFTQRYIERYENLVKTYNQQLNEQSKRLYFLEDNENKIKLSLVEKDAKIKELDAQIKKKTKYSTLIIVSLTVLLVIALTLSVTFIILYLTHQG